MVLMIVATILVLAIASFQVIQGLFSSLIMAILTVLCAALAFTYYEPLAEMLYTRQPGYADAASLVALFVVPLLILRALMDRLIPRNVVFSVWTDRIGGGLLGLITGEILTGVLMLAAMMLPFGPNVLTYRSHGPDLRRNQRLWPFRPVEFTLGLVNNLSMTSLRGDTERTFKDYHDDLLLEAFCARNDAGLHGRVDSGPGAITIHGVYEPSVEQVEAMRNGQAKQERDEENTSRGQPFDDPPRYPLLAETELQKLVLVRVAVNKRGQIDEKDRWWRLPATHFRLVTDAGRSYYPVAYLTAWKRSGWGMRGQSAGAVEAPWRFHIPKIDREAREAGALNFAGLVVEREWATLADKSRAPQKPITPKDIVAEVTKGQEPKNERGRGRGRGRDRRRSAREERKKRRGRIKALPKQEPEVEITWVYSVRRRERPARLIFRRTSTQEIRPASVKRQWPPRSKRRGALDRRVRS